MIISNICQRDKKWDMSKLLGGKLSTAGISIFHKLIYPKTKMLVFTHNQYAKSNLKSLRTPKVFFVHKNRSLENSLSALPFYQAFPRKAFYIQFSKLKELIILMCILVENVSVYGKEIGNRG